MGVNKSIMSRSTSSSNLMLEELPSKLPRPVNPPAFPTGTAPVRFMKAAIAANSPLVAVMGGLGYIGSHVVARMLSKGYFVRAIVPQGANCDFLTRLPGAHTRLQVIPVRDPAAEDARSSILIAFRGVSTVIHAASFSTHAGLIPKHVTSRRIVDALKISLDAATTPGNVITNFIYVSSELAVFDPRNHPRRKLAQLSENDWYDCSRTSRETTHAFAYAHTVAEMRLWARVGRGGLPFNVCSVIPSFVLGPVLSSRQVESTPTMAFITTLANGRLTEIPDLPMSPVDVRDVARGITALTERPEISGRILLSAEAMTLFEFLSQARTSFPSHRWPEVSKVHMFRKPIARGDAEALKAFKMADFAAKERQGRKYAFSQQRAYHELGLTFRSVHDTMQDTLASLQRFRALPIYRKKKSRHSDIGTRVARNVRDIDCAVYPLTRHTVCKK